MKNKLINSVVKESVQANEAIKKSKTNLDSIIFILNGSLSYEYNDINDTYDSESIIGNIMRMYIINRNH